MPKLNSNHANEKPSYWFPAKRIGWGWGLPIRWQGWVVYGIYFVVIAAMMRVFPVSTMPSQFAASTILLSLVLVVICWIKGERPH